MARCPFVRRTRYHPPVQPLTVPNLDLPGLAYGFETRLSAAPDTEREAGRGRVRAALAARGQVFFMTQVHGVEVVVAPWEGAPEADAGLTRDAGRIVAVETADCVPILLVDPPAR